MAHSSKKLAQLSLLLTAALLSCANADSNIKEIQIKIADEDEAQMDQGSLKMQIRGLGNDEPCVTDELVSDTDTINLDRGEVDAFWGVTLGECDGLFLLNNVILSLEVLADETDDILIESVRVLLYDRTYLECPNEAGELIVGNNPVPLNLRCYT